MILRKFIALLLLDILVSLVCRVFAPIIALFADDKGWLPTWLWWFQTPNDSLDADYGGKRFPGAQTGWKRWYSRVAWLERNPAYAFNESVLGVAKLPGDTLHVIGDEGVGNRPLKNGLVRRYMYRDGKCVAFQWYYVKAWSKSFCIRINLGWKLWNFNSDTIMQYVFSPNPFMGYSE